MIKTKYIEVGYSFGDYKDIDKLINHFIKDRPSIEIIDIKYQSNISAVVEGGVSGTYYHTSALIIYKEN